MNATVGNDHVSAAIYSQHIHGAGRKFNNNPAQNRVAVLQRMYYRILVELCVNRFKWEGLPRDIDVRFMELTLFNHGLSVFFKDPEYNRFMALQGASSGQVNMQGNPTMFTVVGPNYRGRRLRAVDHVIYDKASDDFVTKGVECVPIWSNYLRVPDLDIVLIYASKFAELDRTIEINSKNARRSKVIVVDENSNLSLTNIVRQLDEGSPLIKIGRQMMDGELSALDLGVHPDSIEKLHILKQRLWNECMTYLGIKNANQDKKERLVADEVDANAEQVESTRAVNLNARRHAAEQMNELYGLNVHVAYHTDAQNVAEDSGFNMGENESEVGDNGDIYSELEAGD